MRHFFRNMNFFFREKLIDFVRNTTMAEEDARTVEMLVSFCRFINYAFVVDQQHWMRKKLSQVLSIRKRLV